MLPREGSKKNGNWLVLSKDASFVLSILIEDIPRPKFKLHKIVKNSDTKFRVGKFKK